MNRIGYMVRKEFQQMRRDRRMLRILFMSPIIQLVILGYAANLDVRAIPTVVCDLDRSSQSRELAAGFFNSGYFTYAASTQAMNRVDRYLSDGKASIALIIPKGFGDKIAGSGTAGLQVIADGSESNVAISALNYAAAIVGRYSTRIVLERLDRVGVPLKPVEDKTEARVWYNPDLKSRNFMVPGILAHLLMIMTMMLTSLAIVKEKENGTLEQLIVTPIRPVQLILGKLIPFILIGFIDIIMVLVVALLLFGVRVRGSLLLLFGLSGIFLLSTLGLGLLISTLSRNQQQAMMTSTFFVMTPMIVLSGFVFPIENMPRIIQYFTYLMPLRYFFVIVRGLFLKGSGLAELWGQALILLGFGVAILGLSALRFRKRLE
jgi:ABC-2 type transport system permease protein